MLATKVIDRSIKFQCEAVQATLAGIQTTTRRVVRGAAAKWLIDQSPEWVASKAYDLCPYGEVGHRLWVLEPWSRDFAEQYPDTPVFYRADDDLSEVITERDGVPGIWCQNQQKHVPFRWRGSRYMRRRDSRILLEITDIRVERLQDITEDQAQSEGVRQLRGNSGAWVGREGPGRMVTPWLSAREAFRDRWDANNCGASWDDNPWVWCIEFSRVTAMRTPNDAPPAPFPKIGANEPVTTEALLRQVDQLQKSLIAEREGHAEFQGMMNDAYARLEIRCDAALAELKTVQAMGPAVKLIVSKRSGVAQEPTVTFSPSFAQYFDDLQDGQEVSLYSTPSVTRFRDEGAVNLNFPTALRKMWSGGEVQQWLKDQGTLYAWPAAQRAAFQLRTATWVRQCFGEQIANDEQERNHRFLEEALELVQACGATADEAHALVDYVFGRDVGEPSQEVGGVMVTLAALCHAAGMNMHQAGDMELDRINQPEVMDRVREKQKAKPAFGPLPGSYPDR